MCREHPVHILAQEFQVQNSSNKATPQNILTHSLTNTALNYNSIFFKKITLIIFSKLQLAGYVFGGSGATASLARLNPILARLHF